MTNTAKPSWRSHKKIHPACDAWPAMSDEQKRELADDIKQDGHGQLMPIHEALWKGEWVIVDGRSRLDARELNGEEFFDEKGEWRHPELVRKHYVTEDQIPALVVALNAHRLHLPKLEIAEAIAEALKDRLRQVARSVKRDEQTGQLRGSTKDEYKAAVVTEAAKHDISKRTVERVLSKQDSKGEPEPAQIEPKPKRPMTLADIRAYRAHAKRHLKECPAFARLLLQTCDEIERLRAIADEKHGAFSDFTLMPFGKHRGQKLADVPDDYLEWWLRNNSDRSAIEVGTRFGAFAEKAVAQQKLKLFDYLSQRFGGSTFNGKDYEQ
jgi:hypothetical protein